MYALDVGADAQMVKDRETHLALHDKPTEMLYRAILADAPSRN